jgi:hypothetical protein
MLQPQMQITKSFERLGVSRVFVMQHAQLLAHFIELALKFQDIGKRGFGLGHQCPAFDLDAFLGQIPHGHRLRLGDASLVLVFDPRDDLHQRRLARAVGPGE